MALPRRLLLAVLAVLALAGCDRGADLRKAAATFTPPTTWTLAEGGTNNAGCLSRKCTRLATRWETADRPTAADVRTLMTNAGWTDIDVPACEPRADVVGAGAYCTAHARSDGLDVQVSLAGPRVGDPRPWWVTLTIQR